MNLSELKIVDDSTTMEMSQPETQLDLEFPESEGQPVVIGLTVNGFHPKEERKNHPTEESIFKKMSENANPTTQVSILQVIFMDNCFEKLERLTIFFRKRTRFFSRVVFKNFPVKLTAGSFLG